MRTVRLSLLVAAAALAAAAPATAQQQDLIVQSTTSVRDSGILTQLIEPMFEKAYPQYALKFVSVGTGQALTNARAGQGDALIIHAPAQEVGFVADGYSQEPSGRLIMWNDFVIVGPASDPAGVAAVAPHDAVGALEAIAAAGASGRATFVSRGDRSGTNVKEQEVWSLSNVTHSAAGDPTEPGGAKPSWYQRAGVGMADTLRLSQQCPFTGGCYTITDRGTLQQLVSNGAITGLKILMEGQQAPARGGANLMVNIYHAYAISQAKYPAVNLQGALALADFMSSKAFQDALAAYPSTAHPGYFPAAFPRLTLSRPLPRTVSASRPLTVRGTLASVVPGDKALDGIIARLATFLNPLTPVVLDRDPANPAGAIALSARLRRSGELFLTTPRFRDLSPLSTSLGRVRVRAVTTIDRARPGAGDIALRGRAWPAGGRRAATLQVLGRRAGASRFSVLRTVELTSATSRYAVRVMLHAGKWQIKTRYTDAGIVDADTSATRTVTVR